MELLQIIFYLVVAVVVGAGYFLAMAALNSRCLEKYEYEPLTIDKFGLIVAACVLLFFSAFMSSDNFYVAVAFAAIVVLGISIRIYLKTSFLDSLAAMVLLLLGAAFVFLLLLAIWANSGGRRDDRRD